MSTREKVYVILILLAFLVVGGLVSVAIVNKVERENPPLRVIPLTYNGDFNIKTPDNFQIRIIPFIYKDKEYLASSLGGIIEVGPVQATPHKPTGP